MSTLLVWQSSNTNSHRGPETGQRKLVQEYLDFKDWECILVADCLPSIHKALGSIPASPLKPKKKKHLICEFYTNNPGPIWWRCTNTNCKDSSREPYNKTVTYLLQYPQALHLYHPVHHFLKKTAERVKKKKKV
jgi:hypothetical protein